MKSKSNTASLLTVAVLGGLAAYAYLRGVRPGNFVSFPPSAITAGGANLPPPFGDAMPANAVLTMRVTSVSGQTVSGTIVAVDANGQHVVVAAAPTLPGLPAAPPVTVQADASQVTGVGKPAGVT